MHTLGTHGKANARAIPAHASQLLTPTYANRRVLQMWGFPLPMTQLLIDSEGRFRELIVSLPSTGKMEDVTPSPFAQRGVRIAPGLLRLGGLEFAGVPLRKKPRVTSCSQPLRAKCKQFWGKRSSNPKPTSEFEGLIPFPFFSAIALFKNQLSFLGF